MEPSRLVATIDNVKVYVFVSEKDGLYTASVLYGDKGRMLRTANQQGAVVFRLKHFAQFSEQEAMEALAVFMKTLGSSVGPLQPAPEPEAWQKAWDDLSSKAATGDNSR